MNVTHEKQENVIAFNARTRIAAGEVKEVGTSWTDGARRRGQPPPQSSMQGFGRRLSFVFERARGFRFGSESELSTIRTPLTTDPSSAGPAGSAVLVRY